MTNTTTSSNQQESASSGPSSSRGGSIRVLTPDYTIQYLYTCPKCGCHVVSHFDLPLGEHAGRERICMSCTQVYPVQERARD